ncbi:MAG: NAD(P)-binding domain-containing protein [Thermomicrobiales bacterium]
MTNAETNVLQGTRIAFIGAGVMAESMLAGLLNRGLVGPDQIVASHPRADRRKRLEERFGITAVESNLDAARGADLVLLTIKPQVLVPSPGSCSGNCCRIRSLFP